MFDEGIDFAIKQLTRGRPKRKRRAGAGTAVKVGGYTRSPRGSNRGKPAVRVDGHRRGKGRKKTRKRR